MFKTFLLGLVLSTALTAAELTLPTGVATALPSCGGTVLTHQTPNGQVNLVFEKVEHCSNFDILSRSFGILDVNYQNKKIPSTPNGQHSGSFSIPKAYLERGMNEIRVEVRSDSRKHSDTINLVFVEGPATSLRGVCIDGNGSNFAAAKAFAYSNNGLNYTTYEAERFAAEYVRTHRCGTIAEFQARFRALYEYSEGSTFLDRTSTVSRAYALRLAEETPVAKVNAWKALFPHVYDLFNNNKYLDLTSTQSRTKTEQWISRGNCGDAQQVASLKGQFTRKYEFAYSRSGLNLSSTRAREYAASQVTHLTPCADLLTR